MVFRMAGIYIHIPFCKQACHYCDFHFSTSMSTKDLLLGALAKELVGRKNYLQGQPISTVYFGGGTPSILSGSELKMILNHVREHYVLAADCEITLEANPDDLSAEKLAELKAMGVNRLSIGIQSFQDEVLTFMNRSHMAKEARACVVEAQKAGFDNISIDLIYAVPSQSMSQWKENLAIAIGMGVQHISAYSLTVEEKTVLAHQKMKGLFVQMEDEAVNEQFQYLISTLADHGFEHYEISNFAQPAYLSKHNSAYWKDHLYLGIGPSAHSYDGKSRQWNIANNVRYSQKIKEGSIFYEQELLSPSNQFNEYLMTGLRTKWGIDMDFAKSRFGIDLLQEQGPYLATLVERGKAIIKGSNMALTKEGWMMSDTICAELFKIEV